MIEASSNGALTAAINDTQPVSGMSHTFYKYPARFSPVFVREVIAMWTRSGDVVLDPFVGGGTTLVEAMAAGRSAVGIDINQLAVFVTKVKTTLFTDKQLASASACIGGLANSTCATGSNDQREEQSNCSLNMNDRGTWRIRRVLAQWLANVDEMKRGRDADLVRCILLRTAQWALDCRKETPSLQQYRNQVKVYANEAIGGAKEFRQSALNNRNEGKPARTLCILRSVVGAEDDSRIKRFGSPSLVITSPPYPGVHVLYHRWQVNGRRETAAPYWIANLVDGQGASYYTFADRNRTDITKYLKTAQSAFVSIRRIVKTGTPLIQMVAFANPEMQLGSYLEMLDAAGWSEMKMAGTGSRLWRVVPGRKWYTSIVRSRASRELVLFHEAK